MYHGYIDESRRGDAYLLTVTSVPAASVQVTRRLVRDSMERARQRTHFVDERPASRRRILDAYGRPSIHSSVVIASYSGGDDQVARNACLEALLDRCDAWELGVLILDTRGSDRDRLDRQVIGRSERERVIPRTLQYDHRGSRSEPLLSLPDAVGWCYGAGGEWRRRVERMVAGVIKV